MDLRDFEGFQGVCWRERRGDCDGDGDIDLDDYGPMADCLYGPATLIPDGLASDCLSLFDFEGDGDVDLGDFAAFEGVLERR